ncbi:unnamed protein product (macronuclear) [Paramecium tetraurelia]|uniref:PH domain-containing protein n=1 Tax=Paramecium tetraurelia TaxID=5888 RepID=A0C1A4_PARTE|nr:uncharacterized protein GSPATT00034047001 [Paramecium tetraurelia]CAK64571.1 unnamed protein product [Paramecium tetraurelia]|eukprot:XP_001431969.1 hypothetical protein (macronuclear) [Paramecium tetraurelia strain d4-2]
MFEKIIENLLQSILGEYIEGLDQQSLKVGLWSGDAKIENLRLKPEAFIKLDLPFIVKYSRLGTLNLNIPWKNLASAPIKANLDTLYLILTPQQASDWKFGSVTGADKLIQVDSFKQKLLERIANKEQQDGMMQRIIIRVIENLQIRIQNIHIRVEDGQISYGFVLQNFTLLTVNEQGVEQFIDRTSNKNQLLIKSLQISNIGFYWQWKGGIQYDESKFQVEIPKNDYLFRLSLQSKVVQPPKQSDNLPDYKFDLDLQSFDINFSKPQVQQILNLTDYLNSYNRAKISFQRQQQMIQPLNEMDQKRVKQLLQLVQLDKKYNDGLNKEQKLELCAILEKTQIKEIKPIVLEVIKEQQYEDMKQKALKKKQPQGFLQNWFGRGKQQQQNETPTLLDEESEEIYKFLQQNFSQDESQQNQGKVTQIVVSGKMRQGTITLSNPRQQKVDEIKILFQDLICELKSDKDLILDLSLIDMIVLFNDQQFLTNTSNDKSKPIFLLNFKIIESITTYIQLETRSSKLRFHPDLITVLSDFSDVELKSNQIKNMADDTIQELKQNAQIALANQVIVEKNRWVNITMDQFYFELPLNNSQESWLFCPGLVNINSSIVNSQELYKIQLSNIGLKHQSQNQYSVIDNFTIVLDILLPNQKNQNLTVNASIQDIITNLNPQIYQKLTKIGDCFIPTVSAEEYKKQTKSEEVEKTKIIENAIKIAPLYIKEGQLNQWVKYTCVLSGSYLYFYSSPKSQQPNFIKYLKNSNIIEKGMDEYKMNVLVVQIENNQFEIGVQNQSQIQDWIQKISSLRDEELELLKQLEDKQEKQQIKPIEFEQIINFTISVVQINLQDSNSKQFLVMKTKDLSLRMKIHSQFLQVQLTLSGLQLQDSLRQYHNKQLENLIISEKENGELIEILFNQTSRNSKKYQDIDQQIELKFGKLHINFKSETFAYLLQFINSNDNIQNQQEKKLDKIEKEFLEAEKQFLLLKLNVQINQISLSIVHEITKLPFVDIQFQNSFIEMLKYQDELQMQVNLGNLQINDLTNHPYTLTQEEDYHLIKSNQIVGIKQKGESLLFVKIILIEPLSKKAQLNRDIIRVDAKISQIVADYQQQPILRIIDYIQNLQEPFTNPNSFKVQGYQIDNVANQKKPPSRITIQPSKEESIKITSNPPRMKLTVQIDNPQIIIRNKFSNEFMIINLGQISVANEQQQINQFFKEIYTIQITQLNIIGECDNKKGVIASDFNLLLTVTLPDLVQYYKQIHSKVEETIHISCEMSEFILNIDRNTMKLINRLVAYNFTLNDSFNEYVLLNSEKSNQISQEQQKIILKQDAEKKIRNQDYFLKFKLKIVNISIFLCLHRPLIRLSIVDSNIEFNMKKDDKKELIIQISSFNSCVYEQINGYFVSKPLIGIQEEKQYDNLNDLTYLIKNASSSEQESGKIEMYINPTQNKTHNKLYLTFGSFLLTIQTKIILQTLTIFESEQLNPFVNEALKEYQSRYDQYLRSQQKEEEVQPTDSQIFITLGDVIIAIPSNDESILTFTGKFNIIVNTHDTMNADELLCIIKEKGLNEYDLIGMNFKIKTSVSIEQVQAYVASKQQLYSKQFNLLDNKRQIIWPFTMLLNQSQQLVLSENLDSLVEKQSIKLSLSQFQFRIAFTDVLFIQNQINNQLQIVNDLTNNDIKQQQKQEKNQQQQNSLQNFELVIDGIDVIILNDIENYYQYIMNFKLFQTQTKLEQTSRNFKFLIELPIQLHYFNQNIGIWEPIIEKCVISIVYQKDLTGFDIVAENQLDVQIKEGVNINVSTQMILTVYSALTILTQKLQAKDKNQINCQNNSYAKYSIYNLLGSDVLCETQDNTIIIAQHNEQKDFDVKNPKSNNSVSLQIQGDKNPFEILNWNIDKLQQKMKKIGNNSPVLIKNFVDQLKNQRVIYLSSEYIFENNTQTHLDIVFKDSKANLHISKLQAYMQDQNARQVTCQPNQYVLPQFLLYSDFYIRKANNNQEKSQAYNIKYLQKCFENKEGLKLWLNESFIITLNVRKDPEFLGRYIIYIQPNFRFQNLLPFPVTITTLYETKQGDETKLQPLQYLDEHQLKSIKENHAMLITIDAYKPSQPIPLLNSRNFKSQQNVINLFGREWQGSSGGKSELVLEYNNTLFNQSGLCSAVLYAQEYIRNETQYEYVVFQGKNKQYTSIGGQKLGSKQRPLILNNTAQQYELVFSERDTPQVLSLTPAQIISIGTSISDIVIKRNEHFYVAPLAVVSEIKLIQQTCQKVVTVRNRIILVNHSEHSICIKQLKAFEIKPQERVPLEICCGDKVPESTEGIYQFQFTFMDDYNWSWSGQIECNMIGVYYQQLRSHKFPEIRKFAQIDINESNGILFAVISETKHDQTPYRITNLSKMIQVTVLNIPASLDYNQDCYFAWDELNKQNEVQFVICPKVSQYEVVEYQFKIDKIAEAKFFVIRSRIPNDAGKIFIKLKSEMNGFTRHAQFFDSSEEELQRYKENSGKIAKEPQQLKFDIMIPQINISLIDNHASYPQEIINIVLYQSEAILLINKSNKAIFQFKLSAMQIDNTSQLHPLFPVLLTLLPSSKVKQQLPILNVLIQMNLQAKQLQLIEKFSLETNRLAIKINDTIIKTLLSTVNKITSIIESQKLKLQLQLQQKFDWRKCPLPDKLIPTYFGTITIYPIIVQLTVQWGRKDKDQDADNPMFTSLLSGVGFQLVSVDEAEIVLKGIQMEDVFDSIDGLRNNLTKRYLPDIYGQLPAILGSLAVLGNPTKLWKNFVSGMQDFIERPIEGFTKGPLEGGMGVITGTTSLVSHTVSGVFNSVKNVVGTISSGLSKVTMDDNYQQQRQIQNQQQARNVSSGIQEGSVSLVKGVAGGIAGFFSKPIQGAQQDGASGLLKGLWQGTSGLIIKPVAGVLDVISKTSEGVKNQLSSDEQPNNTRIRYMRPFYESDGYFKEYNWVEAECYEVIKGIKKGKYEQHRLLRVVNMERDKKSFGLILTDTSLILFDLDLHLKLWSILYEDIENIVFSGNVIQLKNKKSKRAFQGKSIASLTMASQNQSQQITEQIKFMIQQL